MAKLKWINLITPEDCHGEREQPRCHSLGYYDGGDRLITTGVIPHGAQWLPATRADRDRLVKWLKALDYSRGSDTIAHMPRSHQGSKA